SATDAATVDATANLSGDDASRPAATADGSAKTDLASKVTTNSQPATDDSTTSGTHVDTLTQTASASPPGTGLAAGHTFLFPPNSGTAPIANFHPVTGVVEIDHTIFADFHALLAVAQDDALGNAVITADPHDSITIKNTTVAQLVQHQGDFHFT